MGIPIADPSAIVRTLLVHYKRSHFSSLGFSEYMPLHIDIVHLIPLRKPILTREGILGHEFDKGKDSSLLLHAIHSLFY